MKTNCTATVSVPGTPTPTRLGRCTPEYTVLATVPAMLTPLRYRSRTEGTDSIFSDNRVYLPNITGFTSACIVTVEGVVYDVVGWLLEAQSDHITADLLKRGK
jgi:hypothetical protein